jgi:hypothetical protein
VEAQRSATSPGVERRVSRLLFFAFVGGFWMEARAKIFAAVGRGFRDLKGGSVSL